MIKHKQKFLHDPANGVYGDCDRTAIACVLDLDLDVVPHFLHAGIDKESTNARGAWLRRMGWVEMRVCFPGETPLEGYMGVLHAMEHMNAGCYWFLTGQRAENTGFNHVVVCCGGTVEHDPHPANPGVHAPATDGFWHVSWLVPIRFCDPARLKV